MNGNALKFSSWNIHGYNSRDIGNKFCDQEFLNTVKNDDFVGVTETHIHDEILDKINIPGFYCLKVKNKPKNHKSNTAPGGIADFVKESIRGYFSVVEIENEDAIWVKICKEFTSEDREIFIGTWLL